QCGKRGAANYRPGLRQRAGRNGKDQYSAGADRSHQPRMKGEVRPCPPAAQCGREEDAATAAEQGAPAFAGIDLKASRPVAGSEECDQPRQESITNAGAAEIGIAVHRSTIRLA